MERALEPMSAAPVLRRVCACGGTTGPTGECEACRRKRLQRTASSAGPAVAPPIVHDVLRSSGQPLDAWTRAEMEPRFGHSFADVRVHADGAAAESARAVGAHAYAVGRDVVFGAGRYAPGSADGRRLIAHELAHVVQQRGSSASLQQQLEVGAVDDPAEREAEGAAEAVLRPSAQSAGRMRPVVQRDGAGPGALRRMPAGGDDIHDPLVEAYRREHGLPAGGIDPNTGEAWGPSAGSIRFGGEMERWLRQGEVPAPASAPVLAQVPGPLSQAACGTVQPGTPVDVQNRVRGCIQHARYVNVMNQAASNMRQVETPYAPGLAAMYRTVVAEAVRLGSAAQPLPGGDARFRVPLGTVAISSGVSLPSPDLDIVLEQRVGGANGSVLGTTLTLNEMSDSMLTGDHTDVERTLYHEGFHFFSARVAESNRAARQAPGPVRTVHPELDPQLVRRFGPRFEAVTRPLFQDLLLAAGQSATDAARLASPYAGLQWEKVANEVLSRVEEAVYLAMRAGRGFTLSDLAALPQAWAVTPAYWFTVHANPGQTSAFLASRRAEIEATLLPLIREIQRAYLLRRPTS